jgi:hypothetical protein
VGDKKKNHEYHRKQSRVLLNTFPYIAPEKFNKSPLHAAARTVDSKVSFIKTAALMLLEPVDEPCVQKMHEAKIQKNVRTDVVCSLYACMRLYAPGLNPAHTSAYKRR